MKKLLLLIAGTLCLAGLRAQITLDNTYNTSAQILSVKLHVSGYKYVKVDFPNAKIELYNVNHSLWKTMIIPTLQGTILNAGYVSENLFDLDNLVEYVVQTYSGSGVVPYRVYIIKENSTIILQRDSAAISLSNGGNVYNQDGVFYDGINTKMKLQINKPNPVSVIKSEVYTLPGSIVCLQCSSNGTISGISSPSNPDVNNPVFYPNPVTDQLKLKYELPKNYKSAEINIYDTQGRLIDNFKVTDTFDYLYLPSNYNNGLYLYSLVIDGQTVKTEKVILSK